jgi:hypothetical protein
VQKSSGSVGVQYGGNQSEHGGSLLKDEYLFDYDRFTHDYYEYEQRQKHIIVKGRLRENLCFWQEIGFSEFI